MLTQVLAASLKILMFRAGPQDFPYIEGPGLTRACVAAAILANALLFGLSAPPVAALLGGAVAVGGLSLFTRTILRLRKLENRRTQTLNALLVTGSVLILTMRLPLAEVMPQMLAFVAKVQQNPELADQSDNWPVLPAAPSLLLDLLTVWLFAVNANIFRQATGLGFAAGSALALLCMFNIMLLLIFVAPLLALFGG